MVRGTAGSQQGLRNGEGVLEGCTLAATIFGKTPLGFQGHMSPCFPTALAAQPPTRRHHLFFLYLDDGRLSGMFQRDG